MFLLDNPDDVGRFESQLTSMILGAPYGVDTFFVLR